MASFVWKFSFNDLPGLLREFMYVVKMICLLFQVVMLKYNVIGASSLDGTKHHLGLTKDQLNQIKSEPGMAFTRNVKGHPNKNLMNALKDANFNNGRPTIIWHDAINNSLSNFKESVALNKTELYNFLEESRAYGVVAFLFFLRNDSIIDLSSCLPDVSPPGIIYVDMKRYLPPDYKFYDSAVPHPNKNLEIKCFEILQQCESLMELTKRPEKRRIPGKNRPSKRKYLEKLNFNQ